MGAAIKTSLFTKITLLMSVVNYAQREKKEVPESSSINSFVFLENNVDGGGGLVIISRK